MKTKALDAQYIAHTYARFPIEIVGGHGAVVADDEGKEYIDLGTGIAVNVFALPAALLAASAFIVRRKPLAENS